jgi:tetratricopeptide (TPR) repeat protein
MNVEPANQQPDTDSPSATNESTPQAAETEHGAPLQGPARRLGIPAWTLGILVLALAAALAWAGDAYIRSRQERPVPTSLPEPTFTPAPTGTSRPTPTPTPIPATQIRQTLILVADFADRGDGAAKSESSAEALYEALSAGVGEGPASSVGRVRIARLGQAVDQDSAQAAGQGQDADYVLWGWTDAQGARIHLQRTALTLALPSTDSERQLALGEPDEIDLCAQSGTIDRAGPPISLTLGIVAYAQGDGDAARAYLADALAGSACDTLLAAAHLYLGNLDALAGNAEQALAEYQAALEGRPDWAVAYANRGSVRYTLGDYEAALDDLNRAIEIAPEQANAYYHRANVNRAMDQQDAALADLERAIELDPRHARAYASRALIRHNAGDHEAALDDYTRALELDADAAEVYLNRGGTYATLGQFEAALDDYTRALELDPDDADAYYNRGTVYAMLGAYQQALADLDRALELEPGFAQVYGNRGLVYKALGDTEKAIADLEHFLEVSDNPEWQQMIEQQLAELKQE